MRLLNRLVGIDLANALTSPSPIKLSTQVSHELGIPDIEIIIPGEFHCFIEVKHDSPLGVGQLKSYRMHLDQLHEPLKAMVLLTRSRVYAVETMLQPEQYHHVCWYEIHRWLHEFEGEDTVLDFLIYDFTHFLEEKNMSHQRITWEYERGVSSLIDFTNMLESAIGDTMSKFKLARTAGWSWRGFYLNGDIFVGVRYNDPTRVVFENKQGNSPTFKRDLVFSDAHFFSLDTGEQYETIVDFLTKSLKEHSAQTTPTT